MLTKIALLADSPRVDWLGVALAVGAAIAHLAGVDLTVYDLIVTAVLGAIGRGALLTAKRRAQQAAMVDLATQARAGIEAFRPEPAPPTLAEPREEERRG